jgi:hypothetical protein
VAPATQKGIGIISWNKNKKLKDSGTERRIFFNSVSSVSSVAKNSYGLKLNPSGYQQNPSGFKQRSSGYPQNLPGFQQNPSGCKENPPG